MCGKSCCRGPITRMGVGRVPVAMPHRCANDCASCSATNGTQRNTQKHRTKNHRQNQKRKNASSAATPPSCDSSTAPRRWYKCQHRQERGRGAPTLSPSTWRGGKQHLATNERCIRRSSRSNQGNCVYRKYARFRCQPPREPYSGAQGEGIRRDISLYTRLPCHEISPETAP